MPSSHDMGAMVKELSELISNLPKGKQGKAEALMKPEEFEKDNDANFHIDFIHAIANCRAQNYNLDPMDWLTVKLKAGRIVPALATTTAAVAGLQTLELVKYLKRCKKEDHRNIFLSLAVPIMQASEPADAQVMKLAEGVEVTLWDRWEVKKGPDVTLGELISHIEENYKLHVRDVMKGTEPLYFYAIMHAHGKEKEREETLKQKVRTLSGADEEDKYVDLNVTCVSGEEEKIIEGVPPVRVYFDI